MCYFFRVLVFTLQVRGMTLRALLLEVNLTDKSGLVRKKRTT